MGRPLNKASAWDAARTCLDGAQTDDLRLFKVDLGQRTVVKALLDAATKARLRHPKPAEPSGTTREGSS